MELVAIKREQFGRALKTLRAKGFIPAELYGHGVENLHLSVTVKDFKKVFKAAGESTMIDLMVEGKKRPVMIHEVNTDPVTDEVVGIDFYQVRLDEKLKIKVPLSFVGESAGVREKQGILVKAVSELEIEALPQAIPHSIEVDISKLTDIGTSVQVKDLSVAKDVRILIDPETVVATVTARMTEEEEAKLAAAADVTAIKSEVEEKKEERAAAKADAPAEGAPAEAK
jgi:large subunit ribosomal protein L25